MITVFYDGKCGLCRREMEHYQRIAPADVFDWQDITIAPDKFLQRGYAVKDGLKVLHVEDNSSQMHTGVAAFPIIWQYLPKPWPWFSLLLKIPFVLPLAKKGYAAFAAWRFRRLGYDRCDI